jgi:hypothetical protein
MQHMPDPKQTSASSRALWPVEIVRGLHERVNKFHNLQMRINSGLLVYRVL